jgi:fluoroquinolone resistance protein
LRTDWTFADLIEWETDGETFEECDFSNARLNASRHTGSAFLRCTFRRSNLFDAAFVGCKMTGSVFESAETRPLRVEGGDWSYVRLRGADLHGVSLRGVRLAEADLTDADLTGCDLRDADLSYATLRGAALDGADLRGARVAGVDLSALRLGGVRLDVAQAVQVAQGLGAVVE